MAAVANNPEFAKKVGIPQSVGKEFQREDKKMANCPSKKMKKGGMTKMMGGGMMSGRSQRRRDAMRDEERRMGSMPKMKEGGLTMVKKGDKMVPDFAADGKGKMAYGGKVKAMKKGGNVRDADMAKRGSKGPAYDEMLDREAARKAEARRKRAGGKAKSSEAVQTMRRQQKDLDSRMADMPMMRKGGKVRGCGMAKKGVRPAKMM